MAYFYRLALIAFFCLPAFINNAHAEAYTYPPTYEVSNQYGGSFPTATEACNSYVAISNPYNVFDSVSDGTNGAQCLYHNTSNGTTGNAFLPHVNNQCNGTDQYNGTTGLCYGSCNSPNVLINNVCVPPSNCHDGTPVGPQAATSDYPVVPLVGCYQGCDILWNPISAPHIDCSVGGQGVGLCYYVQEGGYKQTGSTCQQGGSMPTPASHPPNPDPCPVCDCLKKGLSWGTVNGVVTCVPKGTPGSNPVKESADKSVNNPDGSSSSEHTDRVYNSDGTVSQSVSHTDTPPAGSNQPPTTQQSSSNQSMAQFCEQNPTVQACADASESKHTFGGSCSTGFSCQGDAIQCAIARKIHQNKCDDLKDIDDAKNEIQGKAAYTTGQKLMNNDYDQDVKDWLNKSGSNQRTVNIPSSLSESGNATFSGQGFEDYHGTVMGKSFTVPFSSSNTYFNYFGYVLLALTYLAAYKFIASVV